MSKKKRNPLTAILIGAGNRGLTIYGRYAEKNSDKLKFIAVAEPIETRRKKFAEIHNIPSNYCYKTWEDLLTEKKIADIAIICTQDQLHTEPTIKALELGYDVLLEKPMAHTLKDNVRIVKKVEETGRILGVGHVLRYTDFFSTIYNSIQNGLIGNIVNITHRENVGWFHMAHSFVRGNWRNKESSSPMILAKCCHDLDLLYWIVGSLPRKISSVGNLLHFRKENAPKGAPKYCLDGCPARDICLYYAPRIYIDIEPILQVIDKGENKLFKFFGNLRRKHLRILRIFTILIPLLKQLRYWREWPVEPLYHGHEEDFSDEAKMKILKTSPYGRCVYHCDNNVVDHQLVTIEFENGVTANLTMHGFGDNDGRTLRIDGTKGTLIGEFSMSGMKIIFYDHFSGKEKIIYKQKLGISMAQHGGGDTKLIDAFINSIVKNESQTLTNAKASFESHLMAFAAEESRLKNIVVNMKEFRKKAYKL
ncbi:MAG: Gfo/Idh/MocA family oxidoreductase [Promethearchaeota archaeon]